MQHNMAPYIALLDLSPPTLDPLRVCVANDTDMIHAFSLTIVFKSILGKGIVKTGLTSEPFPLLLFHVSRWVRSTYWQLSAESSTFW